MAVDVIFTLHPEQDYVTISDAEFTDLLRQGLILSYRLSGGSTVTPPAQEPFTPAQRGSLTTTYFPLWKPNISIAAGAFYLNPSGQVVQANTAFTTGATYNPSNWTVVSGGSGSALNGTSSLAATGTLTIGVQNLLDATTAPFTATLPTPTTVGQLLTVERADAGANLVSIAGTVRGTASAVTLPGLGVAGESIAFFAESLTSWRILASHKPNALLAKQFDPNGSAISDGGGRARKTPATVNWFEQATASSQWTASNCTIVDETGGTSFGSSAIRLTATTPSVSAQITKSGFNLDTTGQDIIVMVEFASLGDQSGSAVVGTLLGDVQLLVSNNTGFTNYYTLHTWSAGTSLKPALPGVAVPLRFSFTGQSLQTTNGSPTRTGVTTLRLRFATSANVSTSNPLSAKVIGFGLVPTSKTYPNGVITFTFDDGFASHYSQAKAYLDTKGLSGTEYVIWDRLGQPGWLTLQQLRDMRDLSGWDIAPHANTFADHGTGFAALANAGTLDASLNSLATSMRANGFRATNSIAYPKGLYNAAAVASVRNRFNSAVTTSDQPTFNLPDRPDPYLLTRKDFSASSGGSQLASAQAMVDSVKASGGWGIFMIHDIGGTGYTTAADFQALVDYVVASGVAVRTVSQVLESDAAYAPVAPRPQVLVYSGGAYPARPPASVTPAGWATYKGPTQPTDWLTNDEWVNNA